MVAVGGDVDRFVINGGDTDPQGALAGQPLPVGGVQLHWHGLDSAARKPEGYARFADDRLGKTEHAHSQHYAHPCLKCLVNT